VLVINNLECNSNMECNNNMGNNLNMECNNNMDNNLNMECNNNILSLLWDINLKLFNLQIEKIFGLMENAIDAVTLLKIVFVKLN